MKFRLGDTVMLGKSKWTVSAVLWLGERYYMLTRRRNPNIRDTEQVALMPESVLSRVE